MNISAPEHRRNLQRKMKNRLVEWLGPKIPEEWELRDLNLSCETKALTRLRSIFSEIDELFLTAFQRSLILKDMKDPTKFDLWKINLRINPKETEDFKSHIAVDKKPSEVTNLSFLEDEHKIRFWRLAIDFLILEHDGFPERKIIEDGKLVAFPTPNVYASGFSGRVLEIEKIASHLPRQVIEATRSISHLSEPGDVLRHVRTRIDLLDSLFERTFCARVFGQQLVSLAAQIEQSWPKKVPGDENFLPSGSVVRAYPQSKDSSIPTPTIMVIISISSVLSGGLAVSSCLKATQRAGTAQDADFFALIQNSLVQISSIWTMMLTLQEIRLRKYALTYTWFLAAFGLLSAAVAVPAYVLIPTGWSTLLSAAGGISQSLVTLHLVYSVAA